MSVLKKSGNELVDLLCQLGPSLSSTLIGQLEKRGISQAAARKRLERAPDQVLKLVGISFKNNQRFYYLSDQYNTCEFRAALIKAFKETGSDHWAALKGIEGRGGVVPQSLFPTFSGCPDRLKKHLSSDKVLYNLEKYRIIAKEHCPPLGECINVIHEDFTRDKLPRIRACLVAENILLQALVEWLRKNGFVSYDKVKVRSKEHPSFGQFAWDFSAPSYLLPLRRGNKNPPKPGFIVGDVILREDLTVQEIEYFYRKCEVLSHQKNMSPFLPLLVANSFTKEALLRGKSRGLIFTTPTNLFGEEIACGLRTLIDILSNAASRVVSDPSSLERIFSTLGKIEGAAGNLRGPLFELMVGYCVKQEEGGHIEIGIDASHSQNGGRTDIDVLLAKGKTQVRCYECKGSSPGHCVQLSEVEKWTNKQIPIIRSWLLSTPQYQNAEKIFFCFWTSGKFSTDALKHLETMKDRTQKYKIDWKDGIEVRKYIEGTREKRLVQVYKEQYSRHPLSSIP